MKPLTLDQTLTVIALGDNDFIIDNVAMDLNITGSSVTRRLNKVRHKSVELFTYRGLPDNALYKERISGFTGNGYRFYAAAKYFIRELNEIESDIMEIK